MTPELKQLLAAVKTYEGLLVSGGILVRVEALRELAAQHSEMLAVLVRLVEDDDIAQGFGGLYAHLDRLREMARPVIAQAR